MGPIVLDKFVKFGDSMSNGFGDIRGTDFVSSEQTNMTKAITMERNAIQEFRLKYQGDSVIAKCLTRNPPVGWAKQNAAPQKFDQKLPKHFVGLVRTSINADRK